MDAAACVVASGEVYIGNISRNAWMQVQCGDVFIQLEVREACERHVVKFHCRFHRIHFKDILRGVYKSLLSMRCIKQNTAAKQSIVAELISQTNRSSRDNFQHHYEQTEYTLCCNSHV